MVHAFIELRDGSMIHLNRLNRPCIYWQWVYRKTCENNFFAIKIENEQPIK